MSIMNIYLNRGRTFVPFRLKSEAMPNACCSLGGGPPVGIVPNRVDAGTRYFATLGLEENVDVSLFATFEYESKTSPFNFFRATYNLHDQSNSLVQFVVHPRSRGRDSRSTLSSDLPLLGFAFGTPGEDPECATVDALDDPKIYADHKIGGMPVFNQLEGDVGAALALLRGGFVHLLQVVFPSDQDTLINADWLFGEAVFHVFAKKTGNVFEFRYIWA